MGADTSMTVDEFIPLLDDESVDRELIRGRLRERPRTFHTPAHGGTLATLGYFLKTWELARPRPRPCALGFGAGFLLRRDPDILIGSDLSVASAEQKARTPREQPYFDGPPILAVEILEPWDTHGEIVERVGEYLAAGAVVWVVDTDFETVRVYRPDELTVLYNASQELSAEPYLPGFRVAVASIFE